MSFTDAFSRVVTVEGGYSDDPSDSGGKTKFGVTEAVARKHGYIGDMKDMPLDFARAVYKSDYWDALSLTAIDALSPSIAYEIFDTGINCGIGIAGTFLQEWLNVFNLGGKLYPDLVVDGSVGSKTVSAFTSYLKTRGRDAESVMLKALNCDQGVRYKKIASTIPKDEDFVFGWIRARVS